MSTTFETFIGSFRYVVLVVSLPLGKAVLFFLYKLKTCRLNSSPRCS